MTPLTNGEHVELKSYNECVIVIIIPMVITFFIYQYIINLYVVTVL